MPGPPQGPLPGYPVRRSRLVELGRSPSLILRRSPSDVRVNSGFLARPVGRHVGTEGARVCHVHDPFHDLPTDVAERCRLGSFLLVVPIQERSEEGRVVVATWSEALDSEGELLDIVFAEGDLGLAVRTGLTDLDVAQLVVEDATSRSVNFSQNHWRN